VSSNRFLIAALCALATIAAAAQDAATPVPASATTPVVQSPATEAKALTADDVNAWLDGYMPYSLGTGDLAGAVVVIVKDGAILTQRGYGYADVAKKTPVDPVTTLFRPGSVSKLMTWTAVMQLVEQGKLDLDADVNQYLDFQIAPRDGKPITLRQVLTHTAGFEEQVKGILSEDPASPPYDALLKRWTPARVFDAGTTPAYSNYATSLAGYVVQRVSGLSFDDYLDKHIFAPLAMTRSTFRQPLPKELEPLAATGYVLGSGEPKKFEIVGPAPAGSLSSPGQDMAHFMIAHLQDGEFRGQRILKAETARQMHDTPLSLLPPLNRMELGFFETNINGRDVIAHLGDTQNFHTSLHLFRAEQVGFYVSFNAAGKEGAAHKLRLALFADFADRYFPGPPRTEARVDEATAKQHAQMMVGNWYASRGSQSNFLSAVGLIGQTKVSLGPKGELLVPDLKGRNGQPIRWVEVEPFVWHDPDSHDRLAARVVDGRVERWSFDLVAPFTVFLRPTFAQDGGWLLPALIASLVALFLTVLRWPIAALVRRHYGVRLDLPAPALRAYRWSRIGALLLLFAFGGWAFTVITMFSDINNAGGSLDGLVRANQVLGPIGFIGGTLLMLWNLRVVWTGRRGWPARAWSIVLVLSALVLLWIACAFHLIGWGVDF